MPLKPQTFLANNQHILTKTLPSGSEAVPSFTLASVASWQVQTVCILLAHRSILTLINIWQQEGQRCSYSRHKYKKTKVKHRDSTADCKRHLHKSAACRCRWSQWDTRTWSCRSCWCTLHSHRFPEFPCTRRCLSNERETNGGVRKEKRSFSSRKRSSVKIFTNNLSSGDVDVISRSLAATQDRKLIWMDRRHEFIRVHRHFRVLVYTTYLLYCSRPHRCWARGTVRRVYSTHGRCCRSSSTSFWSCWRSARRRTFRCQSKSSCSSSSSSCLCVVRLWEMQSCR